ncbi:MAG: hypothetical protein ABI164_01285 [Acidobacteriaceae bacterium]
MLLLLACVSSCQASDLLVLSAYHRPDPFGSVVAIDLPGTTWSHSIHLSAARGGYVSFQLVVKGENACASCKLSIESSQPVEVYREWFHLNTPDKHYYPDALVPVHLPYAFSMPDKENVIPGQKARAFWVDVWIAAGTKPGAYHGRATLEDGTNRKAVPFAISVLPAVIPAQDVVAIDANSYGTQWIRSQYPRTVTDTGSAQEEKVFHLVQQYYRIFYENRGTFHILGYGHTGFVDPGFAPELEGTGQQKHIASWDRFDRLFGPVLDGSAFAGTHRGPHPVPFIYLPINPDWPASFLQWGEPGYQTEFVNVVGEMERHFREKHWTKTNFEVFFNQKKRYKGFQWDGDEVRFPRDNHYFLVYKDLLKKSLPAQTPVHFIMRADTSWTMPQQMQILRNVIGLWCAGGDMFTWYRDQLPALKQRGDTVWIYGGTPPVQNVSSAITFDPLRAWILGTDGFVRWLAVNPGPDPWHSLRDGGSQTLVYSGDHFGISEPIPSIRLKLQRNAVQDIDLLEQEARAGSRDEIKSNVVQLFDNTRLSQWTHSPLPPPAGSPLDWTNADIDDALKPYMAQFPAPQPEAWARVHAYVLAHSSDSSASVHHGGAQ